MPTTYEYKVRDRTGHVISGSLEADNTALVVNKLKSMGYVPISVDKKSASMSSDINIPGLSGRVKTKEIALFSRQFATLINAGISLTRALTILGGQTTNKHFAAIIDDIRSDVESGSSLSIALGKNPKQFDRLYVAMVRAGEASGSMDRTLNDLAGTLEKQAELRRKIKSAMTYPIAVLSLVIVILTAMLVFVVPVFKKMYGQLGGKLPAPTQILVSISSLMVSAFPVLVVGVVAAIVGFRRWKKSPSGRAIWDRIVLRMPVFGGLIQKSAMARFASTFGSLMRSGVPILEALDITKETAGNTLVADGITAIADGARNGEPLSNRLVDHPVFPSMVTQMISVGEETGALDELLAKVSAYYDAEVTATVDALTSLLEPLMIVVLGGAVGGTVISLYLPMFDIYKLVGKSG